MKKTTILTLLSISLAFSAGAQNLYYDAIFLRKYISGTTIGPDNYKTAEEKSIASGRTGTDSVLSERKSLIFNAKIDSLYSFFEKYHFTDSSFRYKNSQTARALASNPFFRNLRFAGSPKTTQTGFQKMDFPSISSPVNIFADAVAQFLIKRGKEELLISVINRLKDPDKFPEFQILFPNTILLMDNFDSWEYANVSNSIREAFDKDLTQVLGGLAGLSAMEPSNSMGSNTRARVTALKKFLDSDHGRVLASILMTGNGYVTAERIPQIIHQVAGAEYLGGLADADAANTIKLLDILSLSIESKDPKKHYIPVSDLQAFLADPMQRQVFLALLYQELEHKHIVIKGINLAQVLQSDENGFISYLKMLISTADALKTSINALEAARKKGEKELLSYYSDVFEEGATFFSDIAGLSLIDPVLGFSPQLTRALGYSQKAFSVASDLSKRNYSAAVLSTVVLFNEFKSAELKPFQEWFVKYGSFAANLAQAKEAAQAEAAIEAVALPSGSYSVKQKSKTNFSLNAYIGYGMDAGYAHGIYAPLGLSYSFGLFPKSGGAVTVFGGLIDVGSIVSYRLQNGNTEELKQEVRLESIFSPSLQAFFVIPGTPVTLGGGYKRTPKLFYSKNGFEVPEKSRNVLNLSLLIDIPIFTFSNRSRK